MLEQYKNEFLEILGVENVVFGEAMKNHTSFHIGGEAEVFARPKKIEQIIKI